MKSNLIAILLIMAAIPAFSQKATIQSPNKKINVAVFSNQNEDMGNWYLQVNYADNDKTCCHRSDRAAG